MRRLGLAFVLATSLGLGACKQGEGDVCQINDDCESGLNCNAGTGRCQQPGANVIDAGTPEPDAAPPDAGAPDAMVDAAP